MPNFSKWLTKQNDRGDAIGKLAEAAMSDKDFPSNGNLQTILAYLKEKGAGESLLVTFQQAFAEFEAGQKKPVNKKRVKAPIKSEQTAQSAETQTAKRGRKPGTKNKITVNLEQTKKGQKPKFTKANETTPQQSPAETIVLEEPEKKRRGRPKKDPEVAKESGTASESVRNTKQKAAVKVPDRLAALQQQMRDAALLLDAQFGKGFSEANPDKVINCMQAMAAVSQQTENNNQLKGLIRELAETILKFTKK